MTTGANIVLERDHRRVAFAREEPVEPVEQIFVDFAGEFVPLLLQFFEAALQRGLFLLQIGDLFGDR